MSTNQKLIAADNCEYVALLDKIDKSYGPEVLIQFLEGGNFYFPSLKKLDEFLEFLKTVRSEMLVKH